MAGYRVVGVDTPISVYCVTDTNLSHDHDLYLSSLDKCLRDLARLHPLWRQAISERREGERQHAFDYYANRLAADGIAGRHGVRTALRVAALTRSLPDAKRAVASALPRSLRPSRGRSG